MSITITTFISTVCNNANWTVDFDKFNACDIYWNIKDNRRIDAIKHLRSCISHRYTLTTPQLGMSDELFAAIVKTTNEAPFMVNIIGLKNAKDFVDYICDNIAVFVPQ